MFGKMEKTLNDEKKDEAKCGQEFKGVAQEYVQTTHNIDQLYEEQDKYYR